MRRLYARYIATCWLLTATILVGASRADEGNGHSAVTPAARQADWWTQRHETINDRLAKGNVDLVFLGDSITQGWNDNEVWQRSYARRNVANMGIGGDRTQHVLWRLDHGNLEDVSPKLVVLMIGTNNSNGTDNTAKEIADGIQAIVGKLNSKWPEAKILLLAIFPRGEKPNPQREKNATASRLASKVADGTMVHYMDIGASFLEPDGTLTKEIMPDLLHLSLKGYGIWAASIEDKVAKLLGEGQP